MEISSYLKEYKELNIFFAPDYGQENAILARFKKENPVLSYKQVEELKCILLSDTSIDDKYFVADILYLYPSFSKELFNPLIECAIADEDPSFNRIFLRPCIRSFGLQVVDACLTEKEGKDTSKIAGIERLKYWLRPTGNWD